MSDQSIGSSEKEMLLIIDAWDPWLDLKIYFKKAPSVLSGIGAK